MAHDRVFLITGASSGLGAATARAAAAEGWRLVLAARSLDKSRGACDGARRPGSCRRGRMRRHRVGRPAGRHPHVHGAFRPARRRLGERRLRRAAELPRRLGRALEADGADQRVRRRADDSRDDAGADGVAGHLLLTGSVAGRRNDPGSLYSATKHAVHAMGERRPAGAERHRRARHRDRAGRGAHPVLRERPARRSARARRIARAVLFALSQPAHVDVNEILVRPTAQPT